MNKSNSRAWEDNDDQGFRSFKDEDLGHPPGNPPEPAELLAKGEGNLQWAVEEGFDECQVSLRTAVSMRAIGRPIKFSLVHFPRKRGWPEF